MIRTILALANLLALAVGTSAYGADKEESVAAKRSKMPAVTKPVLFNMPEADRILEALQVFPPDNPWNQDVSRWPVHPDSKEIIASIGPDKPLRYNPDMSFVLVPPDQKKVQVKLLSYSDESDPGPFPVPDILPIEGWPAYFRRSPKHKRLTLDDVQRDKLNEGGDRHALVVDPVNRMLYEFYQARKTGAGWVAAQSSVFDPTTHK